MKKMGLLLSSLLIILMVSGCFPKESMRTDFLPNEYFAYYDATADEAYTYFKEHPETCTRVQQNEKGIYITYTTEQKRHNFWERMNACDAKIEEFEKHNENTKVSIYIDDDAKVKNIVGDKLDIHCPRDVDQKELKELIDFVAPRLLFQLLTNDGDLHTVNIRIYDYKTHELLHYHGIQ